MFDIGYTVVRIYENGTVVTDRIRGKRKDVKAYIEHFKARAKECQMFGRREMVAWF